MIDQPDVLAELIAEFAHGGARPVAGSGALLGETAA
jgi:hypothetical protein